MQQVWMKLGLCIIISMLDAKLVIFVSYDSSPEFLYENFNLGREYVRLRSKKMLWILSLTWICLAVFMVF